MAGGVRKEGTRQNWLLREENELLCGEQVQKNMTFATDGRIDREIKQW